jgi:hypothetical protein
VRDALLQKEAGCVPITSSITQVALKKYGGAEKHRGEKLDRPVETFSRCAHRYLKLGTVSNADGQEKQNVHLEILCGRFQAPPLCLREWGPCLFIVVLPLYPHLSHHI